MKKILLFLFILILTISFAGCNNEKDVQKNEFIEKVKTFETNRVKLDMLEITYDEYKKSIDQIFTEDYKKNYLRNLDNETIAAYKGNEITAKELENISEEKLEEYRRNIKKASDDMGFESIEISIEMTDENYEGSFEGQKRVYSKIVKTTKMEDLDPQKMVLFKAYDFKNEDGTWKICERKSRNIRLREGIELNDDLLSKIGLNKVTNPDIEYIETLNLKFDM